MVPEEVEAGRPALLAPQYGLSVMAAAVEGHAGLKRWLLWVED
jgi:hypothetical protein